MGQTATKAHAGGVAGAITVIVLWLVSLIPGWMAVPAEPKGAITFLLAGGIVWLVVYVSPSNKSTSEEPPS